MIINRRLNKLFLMVFILTSVFLLFSCGEPSYCDLTNSYITRFKQSQDANDGFQFTVTCTDPDISKVKNGPGLILGYIALDENITSGDPREVITALKENASVPGQYLIDKFSNISEYGLTVSDNTILSYSYLYSGEASFPIIIKSALISDYNGSESKNAVSPTYHINFNTSNTFSKTYTVVIEEVKDETTLISLKSGTSEVYYYLLNNKNTSEKTNNAFVLYASLTSGTGDFSNSFYSDLVNIGYLDIKE